MESLYKKVKGVFIADLVLFPVFIIALIIIAVSDTDLAFIVKILLFFLSYLIAIYFFISLFLKIVIYGQAQHQTLEEDNDFRKQTNIITPTLLFMYGIFVPIIWYVGAIIFIISYKKNK